MPSRWDGGTAQRARKRLQVLVDSGEACCTICGGPVLPGMPWDADHYRVPRAFQSAGTYARGPVGVSHRRCNRSSGASLGNRLRSRQAKRAPATSGYGAALGVADDDARCPAHGLYLLHGVCPDC